MRIVGKVDGLEKFNRAFDGLAEDFDDMQPTLEEVAERGFYPIMQTVFDTQGRGRWKSLTAASAKQKARRGYGDKPVLQASGTLMRAMTQKRAPGNVHLSVGRDTLLLGSDLPYARKQHRARPIIDFTEKDVDRMTEVAEDSMKKRAERRGFDAK